MAVCPAGSSDLNAHTDVKTSYSESLLPVPEVSHLRNEDIAAMAELPFLKADIREIFEIPLKSHFKCQKRRKCFWRRNQLWRRKVQHHRPRLLKEHKPPSSKCLKATWNQHQADTDPKAAVCMQPQQQQQGQGGMAPQVTVQVQGLEFPQVTVNVQPQMQLLSQRWEVPQVTVQLQQWQQGQGAVTVQVQPQQQSQGRVGFQVTVQVQPQVGHDQERPQGTPLQAEGQGEEKSQATEQEQQENRDEREFTVTELKQEKDEDVEKTEVMKFQVPSQEGPEKQAQDQSQEEEESKVVVPQRLAQEVEGRETIGPKVMDQVQEQQQEDKRQDKPPTSNKLPREMPNYFVSIPVTNDQILDKIEDVQELIFTKEPALLRALIPVQTMHLTIIVAHLRTEEEVKKAVLALKQSKAKIEAILQGKLLNMTFHGIGQFNNQVVYVKMSEDEQQMLSKIEEIVEECFGEMNLNISGSKDFKPHLTLLKLSKAPALRRKGFRKINSDLYKEYEDSFFGTEVFSQIDLCAMHKKKQESGYYHCECSINVGSSNIEEKQEVQTEDLGERSIDILPSSAAEVRTGTVTAGYKSAACVTEDDDKQSENLAEAPVASEEKKVNELDVWPEAKDETFLAEREFSSKSMPDHLPVDPDALQEI
ncbi:A-kinase anchor protein 7 isoform A [Alligator mississippiensis]|uniref:A-kinase anchor protein 7 isoform A n=1 Tax=Alligator mississippiensis TaxID=8496 RepID=A0A151NEV0_ALLMI|nr:A-kinase anchor protein 7 isoform A [Alligator mississippiensis]